MCELLSVVPPFLGCPPAPRSGAPLNRGCPLGGDGWSEAKDVRVRPSTSLPGLPLERSGGFEVVDRSADPLRLAHADAAGERWKRRPDRAALAVAVAGEHGV